MGAQESVFSRLMEVIETRKANPPARSYTAMLLDGGPERIAAKILEEAGEVIQAGNLSGPEAHHELVHEAADLIYHLFVLLGYHDVRLSEVEDELARRFGTSGLDEKASRRRD